MTAMMTEESARIGSRNLSAILALTGFPAIAIAPMLFDLTSMRSLTSYWCCSVSTRFEPPTSLMRGWKPYGLSCSKWGLDLRALLATCGFISPQAGPDAICSWRSGKNLSAFPSLRPVKLASLRSTLQPDSKHSQQSDAGVFSQTALFSRSIPEPTTTALLVWKFTFGSKAFSNQCDFFNRILKTMNNAG